jgi:hypothetical protein
MIAQQRGCVPNYSAGLARTHLLDAWRDIRNMRGWSFQLGNGGFGTPGLTNAGTCSVNFGATTVTADAAATVAWAAAGQFGSLLTQQQFRVGEGTIYNIIAYAVVGGFGTITLDRPYIDTDFGTGLGYSIYQCYYPAPVQGFQAWEWILDINNVIWLGVKNSRMDIEKINQADPQRQIFSNPLSVIPRGTDQRAGSSTFGWRMFELYPQPQSQYAYQTGYSWDGPELSKPSDTLPYPITEHLVRTYARVKAYEWLIVKIQGTGGDTSIYGKNVSGIQFSMGAALKEAQAQLKEIRSLDRDVVDMWYSKMTRIPETGVVATFDPATGTVNSSNL